MKQLQLLLRLQATFLKQTLLSQIIWMLIIMLSLLNTNIMITALSC